MKIITFKKRTLCIFVGIILAVSAIFGTVFAVRTSSPKPVHTIVIDAGHGGLDVK